MKKILLLFLSVLAFISCIDTYRNDDIFIVSSKERGNKTYKYLYRVQHYMKISTENSRYLTYHKLLSNENYELGDTIKFTQK